MNRTRAADRHVLASVAPLSSLAGASRRTIAFALLCAFALAVVSPAKSGPERRGA